MLHSSMALALSLILSFSHSLSLLSFLSVPPGSLPPYLSLCHSLLLQIKRCLWHVFSCQVIPKEHQRLQTLLHACRSSGNVYSDKSWTSVSVCGFLKSGCPKSPDARWWGKGWPPLPSYTLIQGSIWDACKISRTESKGFAWFCYLPKRTNNVMCLICTYIHLTQQR